MKVGQKVKITDCIHGHRFKIGDIGIISKINEAYPEYKVIADDDYWWLSEDEMEVYDESSTNSAVVYYSAIVLVSLLIGALSCMQFNIFFGFVTAGSTFYCLKVCTKEI